MSHFFRFTHSGRVYFIDDNDYTYAVRSVLKVYARDFSTIAAEYHDECMEVYDDGRWVNVKEFRNEVRAMQNKDIVLPAVLDNPCEYWEGRMAECDDCGDKFPRERLLDECYCPDCRRDHETFNRMRRTMIANSAVKETRKVLFDAFLSDWNLPRTDAKLCVKAPVDGEIDEDDWLCYAGTFNGSVQFQLVISLVEASAVLRLSGKGKEQAQSAVGDIKHVCFFLKTVRQRIYDFVVSL